MEKEIARKARDLGFKPKTVTTKFTHDYLLGGKNVMITETCIYLYLCEIQNWLRETYKINVFPYLENNDSSGNNWICALFYTLEEDEEWLIEDNVMNQHWTKCSYEEALKEGLKQGLEELEIAKRKA